MTEIALCRGTSGIVAGSTVMTGEQGQTSRGWQDKSADGCRAHVVGWAWVLRRRLILPTGAFNTKLNEFSAPSAVGHAFRQEFSLIKSSVNGTA